jgi:TonB-dependent starch-binding outer membrane protein SusC
LSEESFLEGIDIINELKLRVSYGVTGSQGIEPLATRSRPLLGLAYNYPFTGQATSVGIAPSNRIANPDLTWEKTAQTNAGLDLAMWNSRFSFSFDLYRKLTSDLLLDVVLPEFLGPNIIARNIGEVENKGFDLILGFIPVQNENFRIISSLNFSANRTKFCLLLMKRRLRRDLTGIRTLSR